MGKSVIFFLFAIILVVTTLSAQSASAAPLPATGPTAGGTVVSDSVPAVAITRVSSGYSHSLGLGSDGNVYAWGNNQYGQLGNGSTVNSLIPLPAASGLTFTQISAGNFFSLGIASNGTTYAWGDNQYGQLGNGSTVNSSIPVAVQAPPGVTFTQISAGDYHALALGSDGNVYAWGSNQYGQLGNGSTVNSLIPVSISGLSGVTFTQISSGNYFSLAVASNGNAYAWGNNSYGRLGNGTTTNSSVPVLVQAPSTVTFTRISAGTSFATALGSDGNAYAWGRNQYGELGIGTTTDSWTPIQVLVPAGVGFTDISSNTYFTVALGSDGNSYAWGLGTTGELGNGTNTSSSTPVKVQTPTGVSLTQVSSGVNFALAIGSDGNAYGWGQNTLGEVGDGTTTNRAAPVVVDTAMTVTQVLFGSVAGTSLAQSGNTWSATAPAGCGPVDITVDYTQFGRAQTIVSSGGFTQGTIPTVTNQPRNTVSGIGSIAIMSAAAAGDDTPRLQWQQSSNQNGPWNDIPGATGSDLSVNVQGTTWVRGVFTNCVGQVLTNPAEITVASAPVTSERWPPSGSLADTGSSAPRGELVICAMVLSALGGLLLVRVRFIRRRERL